MELNNDIEVNASVDEVWEALTLQKRSHLFTRCRAARERGEEFHGIVKIKVGPITAQYKGTATYLERNNEDKKVVIKGDGRDVRGAGNASAIITAQLTEISPTTTQVSVKTELTITGESCSVRAGSD